MRKTAYLIILIFFLPFISYSQKSPLSFSAYLDAYYAYDLIQPGVNQRAYVTQYGRHNEFNINHAWLKAAYSSGKIRGNLALQTGTYPISNYAAEPSPLHRMIYEANAGYQLTTKSWLDIGVFGGHFGYESPLSLYRELLSPALSTEYTPYYQSGIRYTYDLSQSTAFRAVVLNGWQNIAETNNSKAIGIAVDHQVNDLLWISYGNFLGNEMPEVAPNALRFHNNAIVKFTPQSEWSFVGIIDHTLQQRRSLEPGNAYALFLTFISSIRMTDKFSLAGRYEFVQDQDEILITNITQMRGFQTQVLNLAANYQPIENVSFKVEAKSYLADKRTFRGEKDNSNSSYVIQAGFAFSLE